MLRSVHQNASSELSKTAFGKKFTFFIKKGVGGPKVTRRGKKGQKKFLQKILNQWPKWNKKMGDKSFFNICGAFMDALLAGLWSAPT